MEAFQYLVLHYAPSLMEIVELTVVLTGDDHMRDLNTRHFSFDHSTDVLCFPLDDAARDAGFPVVVLGDIVLSVDTAERQAIALGHDLVTECRVLVVHAVLRLLGYDHQRSEREWTEVAEIEREVLTELGWTGHGVIADLRRLMVLEVHEKSSSKSKKDQCEKFDHDKRIRRGLNFAPGYDHCLWKKAAQTDHPSMTSLSTGIRIVELALDGNSSTESSNQGHKRKIEEDVEKFTHDIQMVVATDETRWKATKTCNQTSPETIISSLSSEIFLPSLELLKPTDKTIEDQNPEVDSINLKDSTKKEKSDKEAKVEVAEIEGFEIDHLLERAVLTTSSDSKRPGTRTPVTEILTPLLTQKSTSVEVISESFPDTFKNSTNLDYLYQTSEANSETVGTVFGNKINDLETMQTASEDEDLSSQGLDR